jgi:hypothetical protein
MRKGGWPKILGVCAFNLAATWLLLCRIDPDLRHRLSTMEVFALVVVPAILFYRRNAWPLRASTASFLGVAVITVFTYPLCHELSHVIGVYAVGSRPTEVHLIPRYWRGEFTTGASVASEPVSGWFAAIPGLAPYLKDVALVVIGAWILRRRNVNSAFVAGLVYVTLCLASLFDIVNNYSAFLVLGVAPGNDFYGTALTWGRTWAHAIGAAFSTLALAVCIWILSFPQRRGRAGS